MQWQKEQFREIINQIRSFRDTYFDVLRPLTNMTSSSTLRRMAVSSTDPATVTATASAAAMAGSSEIQVIQSATAARAQTAPVSLGSALGARLSLTDSLATVSARLRNGPLVFDAVSGLFTVNINGTMISFLQNESLGTAISRINNSAAGIHVGYSSFSDTFTFTAKATGVQNITVDDGGRFFAAISLKSGTGLETIGTAGRDAQFRINGFAGSNAANSFTVDGISYNIARRIEAIDNATPVIVSVSLDSEAVFKNIQSFVEDYNKLIPTPAGKELLYTLGIRGDGSA
ncbi:flagellar hook-associated protein 2 [Candidatus Hakubella thermalkaliphila]|nr:flagellar hook-associated protein 2 [Candidatus Hakubella thermalkaliphila]